LVEEGNGSDKYCRTLTAKRLKLAIEKYKFKTGFEFFTSGQKLDRRAIVSLERDSLANLICQADETGRGRGIVAINGRTYVIAKNHRSEGICLVWNGADDSEVSPEHLQRAAKEVSDLGLKRPFRIYGTFCRVGDTPSWKFCQIPDEIIAQMHIEDDLQSEEVCPT
jgi:adenine-specific DNA-methyltransferase